MADVTSLYHRQSYTDIDPLLPQNAQTGRTVLITGSTAGIGLATAQAFLQAGASCIVILGRRDALIASALAELEAKRLPGSSTILASQKCDIGSAPELDDLWTALKQQGIRIDTLILNAGTTGEVDQLEQFWSFYEMNVLSGLRMTEKFLAQGSQNGKIILNVSSARAHASPVGQLDAYGASKAAGASMFQALANHHRSAQLQILSLHPGAVLTAAARNAGYNETTIPWDKPNLPASFMVWAATKQAAFLHGRFVWANWDVRELVGMKARFEAEPGLLRIGLQGVEPVVWETLFGRIKEKESSV